jgi:hypothetical protein
MEDVRCYVCVREAGYLGCVWFGFWLWLLPPKSQKPNQRAESRKQLFLKADFLAVQN